MNDDTTRRAVLGLLASAAAVATAGCGARRDVARKDVVFATQKNGVPFLAQARGAFERDLAARGIGPVRWVEFASGPPLMEALRAGAVDLGLVGDTPVVYAQAAGTDFYAVAAQRFPGLVGSGLVVPAGSAARTLRQLKGKRVAYTKGSTAEFILAHALDAAGLGLKDVVPANLTPGDAQTALANGSIDAWLTWDPYLTLAQARGGARAIPLPPSDIDTVSYYVASGAFVRERPDVLRATLDGLRREAAWGNANRGYYIDRVAAATRLPPPVLQAMLDRYRDFLFAVDPVTPAIVANEQKVADYLAGSGVIPHKVDVAKVAWTQWSPAT